MIIAEKYPELRNLVRLWLLIAMIAICLTGCGPAISSPDSEQSYPPVAIQLSWTYGFQDAVFYAADQNGHFAAAGLDVTLQNGGFDKDGQYINAIDVVSDGGAEFGITDAYNLILARADNRPVVAILAIFQRSPAALISLAETNINGPQDLVGKRVALTTGTVAWTYNAMLSAQQIGDEEIEIVPRTSFGIDLLLNGEADAMSGWIINEGIMVEEAGREANFIVMGDYGTDTYSLVLFTTETMINEQPDLVQQFVDATLAGIGDVVNNPDETAGLIGRYDSQLDVEGQRLRLQASLPFLNPDGSRPGRMEPGVWETTYGILRDQGILTTPFAVESTYDLRFQPASE